MTGLAAAFGFSPDKPVVARVLQSAAKRLYDLDRDRLNDEQHEALTDALVLVAALDALQEGPPSPAQAAVMLDLMARAEERGDWLAVALAQAIAEEAGAFR